LGAPLYFFLEFYSGVFLLPPGFDSGNTVTVTDWNKKWFFNTFTRAEPLCSRQSQMETDS